MTRMVEIEIGKVAVIESGEGINIVLRCSSNFIASAEISKLREALDKLQRKYNSNRIK